MEQDAAFRQSIKDFKQRTEGVRLSKIVADEREGEKRLIEYGFVLEDSNRLKHWEEKISGLRESEKRLARIYLDFEAFESFYVYEDKHEVIDVYNSLIDSIELTTQTSVAVQLVQRSIDTTNLGGLDLQEDEQSRLSGMFSKGSA